MSDNETTMIDGLPITAYGTFAYISQLAITHDETAMTLQRRMLEDTSEETRRVRDYLLAFPIDNFMNEIFDVFSLNEWSTEQFYQTDLGAMLLSHPRKELATYPPSLAERIEKGKEAFRERYKLWRRNR